MNELWESASPILRCTWVATAAFVVLLLLQGWMVFVGGVFEVLDSAVERFSWLLL